MQRCAHARALAHVQLLCSRPSLAGAAPRVHTPRTGPQDVKFGAANVPAMAFIGGGATNYQQWLDFLGLVKDKRCGTAAARAARRST